MNFVAFELFDSRDIDGGIDNKTIRLKWIVYGGDDSSEVDIYTYVTANAGTTTPLAPYTYDGLNRADVKIKNIAGPGGIYLVEVLYGSQPVIACLDYTNTFNQYGGLTAARGPEFQADMTGRTVHITQGYNTPWAIAGGSSGDFVASGSNLIIQPNGDVTLDGSPPTISVGSLIVIGPGQGWTPGQYTVTAVMGTTLTITPSPGAPGTTGGTWTIYSPTVASSGGSGPNFGNLIGVSINGIAGTDVIVPVMEWTVSGVIAPFDMSQMLTFYQLTGQANDDTFWGFAAGEVLYQGATVQTVDGIQFRIVHKFVSQPSLYNIKITSDITVPYKAGWDYLWVYFAPGTTSSPPIYPYQKPVAAYVTQIYYPGDFSQLGIGT